MNQDRAVPSTDGDWRTSMVAAAQEAGSRLTSRERHKNPAIPNDFLDMSDAGFPADVVVKGIPIPTPGIPAEMAQYRNMRESQWLHVPWSFISSNGGADGKAYVPGASKHDLGQGDFVATLSGYFLMFADRHQYNKRRARNSERANESRSVKFENEEEADIGVRRMHRDGGAAMTIEELLEFDKRIGDEPERKGIRLDS